MTSGGQSTPKNHDVNYEQPLISDSDNNKCDEDFQTFASCTGGEKAAVTKF